MPIDLKEVINKITSQVESDVTKTAAQTATPAPATDVPNQEVELQKVAAEMDEAGRVMARAFYDELQKIAVGAHGYVNSESELVPENPAVMVSRAPERMENAMKAVSILTQLTAGERVKGPEGYIQVNGQPVDGTAPEIPVEEHPVAYDAEKKGTADLISKLYSKYFPEGN